MVCFSSKIRLLQLFLPILFLPFPFAGQANAQNDRPEQTATPDQSEQDQDVVDFAQQVQPLFASKCYACHGDEQHEAGLRLNSRTAAFQGGDNGKLLVVGNSADSILFQVLTGKHESIERMPAEASPLSDKEITLVGRWIDQGAKWPDAMAHSPSTHWAFVPPTRPTPPAVTHADNVRNPIDQFVLAKIEASQLKPSAPASKETLLRRLTLDLIGLPPTLPEVDALLADDTDEAIRSQIDRLLDSPHFGERWGKLWLDAARYADSDGFEKDKPRFVWAYRDWVVEALNEDMPYDQFVIKQIAGDLLKAKTDGDMVATGFLRNSMLNEEGGVDPEQFRTEALFDRMDCIGKSILGLTIQCGQCHSHKFDPISQKEYYQLFAFLNNDHEASGVHYDVDQRMQVGNLKRQIDELETSLKHSHPDWQQQMNRWEDSAKDDQPEWTVVNLQNAKGDNGVRYYSYDDGSVRAASYAPTQWTATLVGSTKVSKITAFRLEQLPDPNLPCGGPGRSIRGMSALSEFQIEANDASDPSQSAPAKFASATADFSNEDRLLEPEFQSQRRKNKGGDKRRYGPVKFAIDGNGDTAWGIDAGPGRRNVARKAVFVLETPIEFAGGVDLKVKLQQSHGGDNSDDNQNHNLGRYRLSVTTEPDAVADPIPNDVRTIFRIARSDRSPRQVATVFRHWRTTVPEFTAVNEKIETLWKQHPEGTPTLTLAARTGEAAHDRIRPTRMFKRGDWLQPADEVKFGAPAILHPLPADADSSRLTLARWLVDKRSPTTARVIVNRIWQSYFGVGLVDTPEDFGVRANPPSHPDLLDWLACELMDSGWRMKHIHRLICNSATYQQTSHAPRQAYEENPQNRMLTRGPRLRVDAEIVRDIALVASGLLNPQLGGRGIYPPAPDFLFKPPVSYGPKVWNVEPGDQKYRRSLYIFKFRSVPYPVLQTFDAPNGDFSCVRRERSNTPLQSLITLNETQFMDCARALAKKALNNGGKSHTERLVYAFRRVLARTPTPDELQELRRLWKQEVSYIGEGWVNPIELATGGTTVPADLAEGTTVTQLAAYTVVARVLLNLDEAITKE
ncbi:PSD1 and planctomycete cytochrome C domain-containing protein [Planctomycetota bacterium]